MEMSAWPLLEAQIYLYSKVTSVMSRAGLRCEKGGSCVSKFECIEENREKWSRTPLKAFTTKMQLSEEGQMDDWPKWRRQFRR